MTVASAAVFVASCRPFIPTAAVFLLLTIARSAAILNEHGVLEVHWLECGRQWQPDTVMRGGCPIV